MSRLAVSVTHLKSAISFLTMVSCFEMTFPCKTSTEPHLLREASVADIGLHTAYTLDQIVISQDPKRFESENIDMAVFSPCLQWPLLEDNGLSYQKM